MFQKKTKNKKRTKRFLSKLRPYKNKNSFPGNLKKQKPNY